MGVVALNLWWKFGAGSVSAKLSSNQSIQFRFQALLQNEKGQKKKKNFLENIKYNDKMDHMVCKLLC